MAAMPMAVAVFKSHTKYKMSMCRNAWLNACAIDNEQGVGVDPTKSFIELHNKMKLFMVTMQNNYYSE